MPFKKINIKYENYKIKCIKIQRYHNNQCIIKHWTWIQQSGKQHKYQVVVMIFVCDLELPAK